MQTSPITGASAEQAGSAACGACHDGVDFNTGAGHADLPHWSDNRCGTCHTQSGELEFDVSVTGAHTIRRFSRMLSGVVFELLAVDGARAGRAPTVTFGLKDKSGKPILPSQMGRLNLVLAGPNSDYATYFSEDAREAQGPGDGRYYWTFNRPLPEDAAGSYTVGIEGRRDVKLLEGTLKERSLREAGANKTIAFSVDGGKAQPRRTIVATARCNACHFSLSFHGDNRNAVEQCVMCHNPTMTSGGKVTIDFRTMIHRIHTGKELEREYTIGTHKYNEIGYPGDRRNCGACHVNGSEQLPLAPNLLSVSEPGGPLHPMGPTAAACTGCHSAISTASHARANNNAQGEACAACHGRGAEFEVSRMHAR